MAYNRTSNQKGFVFLWEIENFCFWKHKKHWELTSQDFEVNMLNKSRWFLKVGPGSFGKFGVFLVKQTDPPGFINIHFSLSYLTNYGWSEGTKYMYEEFEFSGRGVGLQLPHDKILFSETSDLLPRGSLIIKCHMWNDFIKYKFDQCLQKSAICNGKLRHYSLKPYSYNERLSTVALLSAVLNAVEPTDEIPKTKEAPKEYRSKETQTYTEENKTVFNDAEELLKFFAEKKFRFTILKTPTKEFPVHQALLCARSPVFCAMFDKDMRENEENIVNIDDMDDETLAQFIKFLHLESLGNLDWETSAKLYYAADKYQVQQLKDECRTHIKSKLTQENVCEVFVLSDMHQDKDLWQCAQNYFCKHSKDILITEIWRDFLLNKGELACEILRKYAEK